MSNRQILGLAAVACVACCVGPILGLLGAITALGLLSSLFIGVAGVLVAGAAVVAFVVVQRRREMACNTDLEPVAIDLGQRRQ